MAQSRYFQINPVRRQQDTGSDVQRGLQIGQEIGKLIGGVAGAVKSAQADAAANKLMNTQNAPRAALVSPGGQNVPDTGGPQPGSGDGADPNADLSTDLPEDVSSQLSVQTPPQTFTNPATGDVQPVSGTGGTYSGTAPDPTVGQNVAAAQLSAPSTKFVPNTIPAGVSTAGTQPFSGGVAGMKLQQEFQKAQMGNQIQQFQLAKAQRDATAAQQEDAGTGRFAVDAAIKRAQLAAAQAKVTAAQNKTAPAAKVDKNAPPVNFNSEPATNDNQVNSFVDSNLGKGVSSGITAMVTSGNDADGKPLFDPTTGQPNPNANFSVPVGKNKVTPSLQDVQTFTKQKNFLRIQQGLQPFKVPGEDQSVGTKDNPYPAQNKLDAMSRARGTWVKLPQSLGGQIVQVGA